MPRCAWSSDIVREFGYQFLHVIRTPRIEMSGTVRLALLVLRIYLFTLVGLLVYKFITVCEAAAILSKHEAGASAIARATAHRHWRYALSLIQGARNPNPRQGRAARRSPLQPEQARSRPPGPALRRLAGIYKRC